MTGGGDSRIFVGDGEMATLMRQTDWATTKLGPVETWPSSLKTTLGVILGSRFPMQLWWGEELLQLYNDAYRPILRDKHPKSLAAPGAEDWAEIWDSVGPMATSVLAGGPSTWQEDFHAFIANGTMAEETYFTFSYSPVPADDGSVGGVLTTVQETTSKVQSERQVRMLHELVARAATAKAETEAWAIVADVLGANDADLPFALFYRVDESAVHAHLVGECGWADYTGPAKPGVVSLAVGDAPTGWPFAERLRAGQDPVVDLAERFGPIPVGRWHASPRQAIILPLARHGAARPFAVMVAGISPHRAFDDRYQQFFHATADQVGQVISNARAYAAEAERAETLAELNRSKTQFFNNVSHEFRTPLTLILAHVSDALARTTPVLEGEDLAAVHRNVSRLLRLVNTLLDFARIESGRLQLEVVPLDLATLTADLAGSFRTVVERAGLRLDIDCPALGEPVFLDPAAWEKIVLNLVTNAFKFTMHGEIAVSLRRIGEQVRLTVRDTGCGIPEAELPRVFERFHRVTGVTGRSYEGTGIGLALVQELVSLQGGTVGVTSREGLGTTFEVTLPIRQDTLTEAPENMAAPTPGHVAPYVLEATRWLRPYAADELPADDSAWAQPHTAGESEPDRARLLVADDNADMRDYLVRLLSARWHVEVAEDGQMALAKARQQPPDLVLSDIMMPKLDGYGLLRELRAHPRTSHIPVVLLSARAGDEALLEGLETGADDYLVKPFAARELIARIRTHLEMARLRRDWSTELERANAELETFSYSVSHDLRAPLRAIDGFSRALLTDYAHTLDDQGRRHLDRVRAATQRMSTLIDDLLNLSRISRTPMRREAVDLSGLAADVIEALATRDPDRQVRVAIAAGLSADGDARLLTVVLENLLGNAWKFTARRPEAQIAVGCEDLADGRAYFVKDNGAGFDMAYADKLFAPFQRMHKQSEFEGTGVGLATVQRIIVRHGGRLWASAAVDQGTTIYFTLGGRP